MNAATEHMETALQTVSQNAVAVGGYQGAFSNASNFEAAQRMAQALVTSSMVPKEYKGRENLGNAIIALELSQRIGASPLQVMQNLYVVHGQPSWSAKFLIATFNQCGRFTAIRYQWQGEAGQKSWGCRAVTTEKETGTEIVGPWITWELGDKEGWHSKNGSKWKTMPEKMFMYRAAAWLIDLYAPEISMGLQTEDQLNDVLDVDPATGEILNTQTNDKPQASRTADLSSKLQQQAAEIEAEAAEVVEEPNEQSTSCDS